MPRPVKCRKVCHFPHVLEFLPADDTEKKMPIVLTVTINNKIVPEDIMISFVEDEFVNFNNEVAKITGEFTQLQSIFDDIKAAESQLVYRLRMGA